MALVNGTSEENNTHDLVLDTRSTFDLSLVEYSFQKGLIECDDIDIDCYLSAYEELCKFCQLMGTVFSFVCSEIRGKMDILYELKRKDQNRNFITMKSMVKYEEENNLLKDSSYVSGCRTFLRLHRGLDFLRNFLRRVGELSAHENTSTVGREVYHATLAKHHSWFIRKGADMAMYVLPTREVLLRKVCGENSESALESLPGMLEATNEIYNRTELYFKEKDLLNLP